MYHKIKEFIQSKKTTRETRETSSLKARKQLSIYQEDYIELKNAYKARKQQEKPLHSKQENNSESIKNII